MQSTTSSHGKSVPRKSRLIGVVVGVSGSYWLSVSHGILDAVRCHEGWHVLGVRPDQIDTLSQSGVEAVIARVQTDEQVGILAALKVPVVNVSGVRDVPFPVVTVDNDAVGVMAAKYLMKLGLRHFTFCGYAEKFSVEREKTFSHAIRNAGRTYHRMILPGGLRDAHRQLIPLVNQTKGTPLGVMATNDDAAATILPTLRENGIQVPSEVAVLGVDNELAAQIRCLPSLSSVQIPTYGIGRRALDLAVGMAKGDLAPRNVFLPPCRVVVRGSTDILAVDDVSVRSALRYIRQNAHQALSAVVVAKAVGVSLRSLQRHFAKSTGTSLQEHIHSVRLDRIKDMLRLQPISIKEVAYKCGFNNPLYMTKFFSLREGISPQEYRHQSTPDDDILDTGNDG